MTRRKRNSKYRSGFEERVANNLRNRGIPFDYEPFVADYEQPVRNHFCPECGSRVIVKKRKYTPDFVLRESGIWIEAKGKFSAHDRTKMLAIQECYPDTEIKLLFMRDNFITKNKATRYSEWAERHGFDYHVSEEGRIPSEWTD